MACTVAPGCEYITPTAWFWSTIRAIGFFMIRNANARNDPTTANFTWAMETAFVPLWAWLLFGGTLSVGINGAEPDWFCFDSTSRFSRTCIDWIGNDATSGNKKFVGKRANTIPLPALLLLSLVRCVFFPSTIVCCAKTWLYMAAYNKEHQSRIDNNLDDVVQTNRILYRYNMTMLQTVILPKLVVHSSAICGLLPDLLLWSLRRKSRIWPNGIVNVFLNYLHRFIKDMADILV